MKVFEAWRKKFDKTHQGNYRYEPTVEEGWRAALEHILRMKISSAYCKTELDVLRDWIKNELEEK